MYISEYYDKCDTEEFIAWKSSQDLSEWQNKYDTKFISASQYSRKVLLTFDQYLFKGFEAGLSHHDDIGQASHNFHLSRINDQGDYCNESCRFLTARDNIAERNNDYLSEPRPYMIGNTRGLGNTGPRGEKNWSPILKEADIIPIFFDTRDNSIIAQEYGVHPATIHSIKQKQKWTHITENLKYPDGSLIPNITPRFKLKPEQIVPIFLDTRDWNVIADEYSVSWCTIRDIKQKYTWKKLTMNLSNTGTP